MSLKPQTRLTLEYLRYRGPRGATHLEALATCGTSRLAARVAELRADGHDVRSEYVRTPNGARIVRYRLVEAPRQLDFSDWAPGELVESFGR